MDASGTAPQWFENSVCCAREKNQGCGLLWEILRSLILFVFQRNGKTFYLIHKPGSYILLRCGDACQIWTWSTNAIDTFAKLPTEKWRPGNRLSIKMLSYQYRDPHVKDKTASRPSYFLHGNRHTCENPSLYWDGAQSFIPGHSKGGVTKASFVDFSVVEIFLSCQIL